MRESPDIVPYTNPLTEPVVGHHLTKPVVGHHLTEPVVGHPLTEPVVGHHLTLLVVGHHLMEPVVGHHLTEPVVGHHLKEPVVGHHLTEPVVGHHLTEPVVGHHLTEPVVGHHLKEPVVGHHFKEPVVGHHLTEPVVENHLTEPVVQHHLSGPLFGTPLQSLLLFVHCFSTHSVCCRLQTHCEAQSSPVHSSLSSPPDSLRSSVQSSTLLYVVASRLTSKLSPVQYTPLCRRLQTHCEAQSSPVHSSMLSPPDSLRSSVKSSTLLYVVDPTLLPQKESRHFLPGRFHCLSGC